MKKSVRFIAIALAFCTVFSIAAFAIQVDGVHSYGVFVNNGTSVDCHGYLYSNIIHFPEDDEMVEVWASTEVSQRTANMGIISVSCTFHTVGGAVIDTHDASTTKNRIASTLNDPVIGPLLALAEAVHEVEYINDADVSLIWRRETSKQLRDYLV